MFVVLELGGVFSPACVDVCVGGFFKVLQDVIGRSCIVHMFRHGNIFISDEMTSFMFSNRHSTCQTC
jgi:hypothetical protein